MEISRRTLLAGGAGLAALPCLAAEVMAEGVAKSQMPKDGVILTAMVKANPGQEDAVREALVALVEPTRKEAGCICYNLHQSKSDKAQFMFYEQWISKEALDAHMQMPYIKAIGDKLKDRAGKIDIAFYELLK